VNNCGIFDRLDTIVIYTRHNHKKGKHLPEMEKEFEKKAKDFFERKKYFECLKECFKCLSVDPKLKWPYQLAGYSYYHLKMFSQSRGCWNVLLDMEKSEAYQEMIRRCDEEEPSH
jgi:hypothetical protein